MRDSTIQGGEQDSGFRDAGFRNGSFPIPRWRIPEWRIPHFGMQIPERHIAHSAMADSAFRGADSATADTRFRNGFRIAEIRRCSSPSPPSQLRPPPSHIPSPISSPAPGSLPAFHHKEHVVWGWGVRSRSAMNAADPGCGDVTAGARSSNTTSLENGLQTCPAQFAVPLWPRPAGVLLHGGLPTLGNGSEARACAFAHSEVGYRYDSGASQPKASLAWGT